MRPRCRRVKCDCSSLWMKSNLRSNGPLKKKKQFRILFVSFLARAIPACASGTQRLNAIGRSSGSAEVLAGTEFRMILWVKALHVIAIIAWMAGMLYLPRLFVYHAEAPKGSDVSATFKVMERRLLKAIINPAMILVFLTGFTLALMTGVLAGGLVSGEIHSGSWPWRGCTAILPAACGLSPRTPMSGRLVSIGF